ncbi:MAG: pilus assembly protein TadG-related protein [Aestuariivirga sp.]
MSDGKKCVAKRGILHKFLRGEHGSVSWIMGAAAFPVVVAAGVAIDSIRINREQTSFAAAVDSAALAVAASEDSDFTGLSTAQKNQRLQELGALAQDYIEKNYQSTAPAGVIDTELTITDTTVEVHATREIPMTLTSLIGIEHANLDATAEVTRGNPSEDGLSKVEIAMVLDTTGSMSGTKITALKNAAHSMKNIVFGADNATNDDVRMAIVPFSTAVNVGSSNNNASWLDTTGLSSYSRANFSQSAGLRHNMWAWNAIGRAWPGCVEMRQGSYATDDTAPTSAIPATLYTPMFAPDEPSIQYSGNNYPNSYMSDVTSSTSHQTRQQYTQKYTPTATITTSSGRGPDYNCKMAPIVPLTSTKVNITNGINALTAVGSTIISEGAAWGWRVLSPTAPFTQGSAYDSEWAKILVIMTDGENDLSSNSSFNGSPYTTVGYLAQNRLGSTTASGGESVLNTRLATTCTNAKATGITVYTIGFQIPSNTVRTLLLNCATDPSKFIEAPSEADLIEAFEMIGNDLAEMYLSK